MGLIYYVYTVPAEIIDEVIDRDLDFDLLENETNPVTFNCGATGEPVPTISWYFNTMLLNVSDASDYIILNTMREKVIESLLIIINPQLFDAGTYTCRAENVIGSDSSAGILTINGKVKIIAY